MLLLPPPLPLVALLPLPLLPLPLLPVPAAATGGSSCSTHCHSAPPTCDQAIAQNPGGGLSLIQSNSEPKLHGLAMLVQPLPLPLLVLLLPLPLLLLPLPLPLLLLLLPPQPPLLPLPATDKTVALLACCHTCSTNAAMRHLTQPCE